MCVCGEFRTGILSTLIIDQLIVVLENLDLTGNFFIYIYKTRVILRKDPK